LAELKISMEGVKNVKSHWMDSNYNTVKGVLIRSILLDMMGKLVHIKKLKVHGRTNG